MRQTATTATRADGPTSDIIMYPHVTVVNVYEYVSPLVSDRHGIEKRCLTAVESLPILCWR